MFLYVYINIYIYIYIYLPASIVQERTKNKEATFH